MPPFTIQSSSPEQPVSGGANARDAIPPKSRRIWIDLDNSPHVPFFKPIVDELEARGYSVFLTARDCFQVCDLAELLQVRCQTIGRHYGKHRIMKLLGLGIRALQLLPVARRERPVLAVSHGSRSQLVAANVLRIPTVQIGDYEFAKVWALIRPDWVIAPAVIPNQAIRIGRGRILKYPGIKEDVYVPSFIPNPGIRRNLGIGESEVLVTMRPPANEAHYHNPESDVLFAAAVDYVGGNAATRIVMLPRNEQQEKLVRQHWPRFLETRKIIIPDRVVNGLDLVWFSDLVISGGGTMNREAAALGVPVYSVFRGATGAVDQYLQAEKRLTMLESSDQMSNKIVLERRISRAAPAFSDRAALKKIVEHIVTIMEGVC
jgi:predicted glycosyltransferase